MVSALQPRPGPIGRRPDPDGGRVIYQFGILLLVMAVVAGVSWLFRDNKEG